MPLGSLYLALLHPGRMHKVLSLGADGREGSGAGGAGAVDEWSKGI